jgi:lysophospholipase L1-like esterase
VTVDTIPPLQAKTPAFLLRAAATVWPGVREVLAQIRPYTDYWNDQNQRALANSGPLLAVIGDSTAIGIGASTPDRGYVGRLREALSARDQMDWRVVNLGQSGAKSSDALERQLPLVERLAGSMVGIPFLTVCCVGTNDVLWAGDSRAGSRLRSLVEQLPSESLVGLVAGASPRARAANRSIRNAATAAGLAVINPWTEPSPSVGRRLASDRFHPNDVGYALMARTFARQLDAPLPELPA